MAQRAIKNKPFLETEGKQTDPDTTDVMADTGALTAGIWEFKVSLGASAAATFLVQRRNAANSDDVGDVPVVYVPAGATGQYVYTFEIETGERVRVMMEANLTGTAAAVLNYEKLG
jgi:hypothetical protein